MDIYVLYGERAAKDRVYQGATISEAFRLISNIEKHGLYIAKIGEDVFKAEITFEVNELGKLEVVIVAT